MQQQNRAVSTLGPYGTGNRDRGEPAQKRWWRHPAQTAASQGDRSIVLVKRTTARYMTTNTGIAGEPKLLDKAAAAPSVVAGLGRAMRGLPPLDGCLA